MDQQPDIVSVKTVIQQEAVHGPGEQLLRLELETIQAIDGSELKAQVFVGHRLQQFPGEIDLELQSSDHAECVQTERIA